MDKHRADKPPIKRLKEQSLRNKALYHLQRHPCSVAHFVTVMDRKINRSLRADPAQDEPRFKTFVRETLVPEFVRLGLLNDQLYAKGLAYTLRQKGLPPHTLKRKLKEKGIRDEELQDEAMQYAGIETTQLSASEDEAAIIFAKRKKLGPFAKAGKERHPQRELAAFARAGFSYSAAQRILKMPELEMLGQDDF